MLLFVSGLLLPSGVIAQDPSASPSASSATTSPGHAFLDDHGTTPAAPVGAATPAASPTLPAGFTSQVVLSGLRQPTTVRFARDGSVWVAEKAGRILRFASINATTPTVFADLSGEVNSYWDRAIGGIALAPNFPTDPSVYVSYAYDHNPVSDYAAGVPSSWNDACPSPPGGLTDGCPILGRLSRLTATSGGTAWTGQETVLLQDWCQQFPSHAQDDLLFGPDGDLYMSAGDGASFTGGDYGQFGGTTNPVVTPANPCGDPPTAAGTAATAPTAEGGGLRSQSVRRTTGGASLDGSLIRIDAATTSGASGNPFSTSSNANARRILAYGLRNPFRFTFEPGHPDRVWIGDVGYSTWEEIDRATVPVSGSPVGSTANNFGWPCYEGNAAGTYFGQTELDMCASLVSAGTATMPYYTYDHSAHVVSNETCRTGSSSISGLSFYTGTSYPPSYRGALFFADHSRDCIWAMLPDGTGNPNPATIVPVVQGASSGSIVGPVDLEVGPGGDIYYVNLDAGTIDRIAYGQPAAVFTAAPTAGVAPLTVGLDATNSVDPAGLGLSYAWHVTGGSCGSLTSATTSCTFPIGAWSVSLTVTDGNGVSNTSPVTTISAGNTGPKPVIDLIDGATPPPQPSLPAPPTPPPGVPAFWSVGDAISFHGGATDAQDGTEPTSRLSWQLVMHHCPSDCHTHQIQTFSGVASGSFSAPDHTYPSFLEITLTVTDSGGLTASATVYLYPRTAKVHFATTPSGISLTAGQYVSVVTPADLTFIDGSSVALGTQQLAPIGNDVYAFKSWSDGGTASHVVVVHDGQSYAAAYAVAASRYAGPDRFATAAAISSRTFAPGVAVAYIAYANNFPDALAGAAAAGTVRGPVLLANTTGTLNASTSAELSRLKPAKIVVLGSAAVISNDVMSQLGAYAPSVVRYAASDRFGTAAAVSAATFSPGVPIAYIAYAYNFPDALAGAAAAGTLHGPVLLAATTGPLSPSTATELSRLKPAKIVILGSTGVISSDVAAQLAAYAPTVVRDSGSDRFGTAAAISAATFSPGVPVAYLAYGYNFPDALAAAAAAGTVHGPVLLVGTSGPINVSTAAELTRLHPKRIVVLGSAGIVSDAVLDALAAYASP